MGNCASISSSPSGIHDDTICNENAVCYINSGSSHVPIGSLYSLTGTKGINQDSGILYQGYGIEDGVFSGVFDGHGNNGHVVSNMVRNRLPALVLSQRNAIGKISPSQHDMGEKLDGDQLEPNKNFLKWKEACISAFKAMDKEIKVLDTLDCSTSGTTAAVVIKQGDDLIIANLGDSRAVLGRRNKINEIMPVQLTTDFKPGVPSEAERITKCKGRVLALREESHVLRVWLPDEDAPGLAMSRAFGDFMLKNYGIIAIPDVTYHRLAPNDDFLVLASDGVWDVLSNEQVMSIVSSARSQEEAAKVLVGEANATWKSKFPNSKRDDCTVICLFLQ